MNETPPPPPAGGISASEPCGGQPASNRESLLSTLLMMAVPWGIFAFMVYSGGFYYLIRWVLVRLLQCTSCSGFGNR